MSKETNLRYEQPHKPSKLFLEYMKNLQSNDSIMIQNIDHKKEDFKHVQEKWLEASNLKIKAKQHVAEKKGIDNELKLVAKANMMVRKKALALRIEAEQLLYEKELSQMGKTFHKQRI
ncbi:hypothetical protein Btru_027639 [Bulinus truncatus]|nr:hypothetical protein Btru_027639 [Bulinus truncatus]